MFFKITTAAQNRTSLRRVKRDGRVRLAFCTMNGDLDPLFNAGSLRGGDRGDPFVFRLFTILASFRRIRQTFIAEKRLFSDRPDKILPAVNAMYIFILKVLLVGKGFFVKFFQAFYFNLCFHFPSLLSLIILFRIYKTGDLLGTKFNGQTRPLKFRFSNTLGHAFSEKLKAITHFL